MDNDTAAGLKMKEGDEIEVYPYDPNEPITLTLKDDYGTQLKVKIFPFETSEKLKWAYIDHCDQLGHVSITELPREIQIEYI